MTAVFRLQIFVVSPFQTSKVCSPLFWDIIFSMNKYIGSWGYGWKSEKGEHFALSVSLLHYFYVYMFMVIQIKTFHP